MGGNIFVPLVIFPSQFAYSPPLMYLDDHLSLSSQPYFFLKTLLTLCTSYRLLEREKHDLMAELTNLPANAVVRRINDLIKRARSVKVHAYIIHYLKKQMPYVIGRSEKQKRLVARLDKEFVACARRYNLPLGDFPNVDQYRRMLSELKDISDFKRLDKNLVYEMDRVLTHDIPMLLQKAAGRGVEGQQMLNR